MVSDNIDTILGIDRTNPTTRIAMAGVTAASALIDSLVQRRIALGMTRADVAERLGQSENAIAKIEAGPRDPRLSTLTRYALALDSWVEFGIRTDTPDEVLDRPRPVF